MFDTKVIVISGVTAGGKTTLVQNLVKEVHNSHVISFDDYNIDQLPSAPSFDSFTENFKKAVNQYDVSDIIHNLLKVKNDYKYIFIDFPFGYEHKDLKNFIHKVVYIKTPLDITFARQIIRDYSHKRKEDILDWAESYLYHVRPIFVEHDRLISKSADYILDGTIDIEKQLYILKNLLSI